MAARIEALFGTTLGTSVAGNGALQVYPSLALHPHGTMPRLTVIPQAGDYFAVWGNATSGTVNPLYFPITNATPTVSCLFAPLGAGQHALAAVADGFGRVTVNPMANAYATQTGVMLTAIPEPGQDFVGWSARQHAQVWRTGENAPGCQEFFPLDGPSATRPISATLLLPPPPRLCQSPCTEDRQEGHSA